MKTTFLLLVLSGTISFVQNVEGARILGMFPFHSKSHFIMFEEVMKGLADAGHQVDVVSHFPQKKPYPNYTDVISLAGSVPMLHNNVTHEFIKTMTGATTKRGVSLAGTMVCNLLELPELQKLIKSPPIDPPYDLVITEFFIASCYFAFGRHLKVPMVAISSLTIMPHSNAPLGNPLNAAIVSEIADRPASSMNFWQRLKNTIGILYMDIEIRYYMEEQNDIVKKHFGPEMPSIDQLERDVSLLLTNSHHIFHGIRPMTPAIVEVAGIHVRDDKTPIPTELLKWLNDSKDGFIYFSLGSMAKVESFPPADLAELYSAFGKIAPIRILMKVANPKELPSGLPDNVHILNWVPQVQVLKHKNIRGFMTHGGLMGVQEAVTFGVPLIGIPLFGDQMGNIQVCVEREIALSLDYRNLKADEIAAAMKAIVNDPKYKNNMKAISKQFLDRPMKARDTAVFWIEYILRNGGDSLRSPAVKLTWWQLALLDIYGTIIAAVFLVLFVFKLILSTIIGKISNTSRTLQPSKKRN